MTRSTTTEPGEPTALAADERAAAVDRLWICPGCGHHGKGAFLELPRVPIHCNVLWPRAEDARLAAAGAMHLVACDGCGLVFNGTFDPSVLTYDEAYENSLHGSAQFRSYADGLARRLAGRYQLRDQLIVEIGSGKGEFLRLLCEIAGAEGLGIDASYDPKVWGDDINGRVRFIHEPFSELPADLQPALICCRHVLEHVPEPRAFVGEMAVAARRSAGTAVMIEVPNVLYTLKDLGIWDLIYEHHLYFSAPALERLVESAGLEVVDVAPAYGGQFLCMEAVSGGSGRMAERAEAVEEVTRLARALARHYQDKVSHWTMRLRDLAAARRRTVVWGAGSKGISFVNVVPGSEAIDSLVDLNPRKHGRFAPGTAHRVVSPQELCASPPDVILVMNPLYREEVAAQARQLGLASRIEVV